MTIAMSVIYGSNSYYYAFPSDKTVTVGTVVGSDTYIPGLKWNLEITWHHTEMRIKVTEGNRIWNVTVPLNRFAVIDNDTQLAVFFTAADERRQAISLPVNGVINIGRSERASADGIKNHVMIHLPFMSGNHLKLVRQNGQTIVYDAGSKNGVYLNGTRISSAALQDGDILSVFTVRMLLNGDTLFFENIGENFKVRDVDILEPRKAAPLRPVVKSNFLHSRSPRLIAGVTPEVIHIEKPPQACGTPQINWLNVLVVPMISIALMFVLVLAMGMNPVMLIMSGVMSVVSTIAAILNYRKQKKRHENVEQLIDQKYHQYLAGISVKLADAQKRQVCTLESENPSPDECLQIVESRDQQLWNRVLTDQDFASVRLGLGTINAVVTAKYKQNHVVITENSLEKEAKQLAENSEVIHNAPILCNLRDSTQIGIIGNRADEIQLVHNMVVALTTAHAYDELKIIALIPKGERYKWNWLRWLPHCQDDDRKVRHFFSALSEAEEILDTIGDVLNRRKSDNTSLHSDAPAVSVPHYIFIVATPNIVERHPIRKQLISNLNLGCSALFVYDHLSALPKECEKIIEVSNGYGEIYDKSAIAQRIGFRMDVFSVENANRFARTLAPLYTQTEGVTAALPTSISFLEGYGVSRPEELNIRQRWNKARPYKSLSVPIAALSGGATFCFDIHEKYHGVNGVVAGMPGSGKTEMIQSWLLSMAVNYSPQDVSFVLIDFKGTGMIAPFRKLPHLAGSISNLDTNIERNLIAIRSEVRRREAIIDKYSNRSIKNINDLNASFAQGLVPERLPVLLIVIDEYAEFKANYPDFGSEIDSLTSKGRALGIFVILMTQKPAGVVSAKSEDNIKFRWCLRVANYSASREMLGRPDAAKISCPGRAYVKVGEDDVYEQVQSFWSGASYNPDRNDQKKVGSLISKVDTNGTRHPCEIREHGASDERNRTEIDVIVEHIIQHCNAQGIENAQKIWTDRLPERLYMHKLLCEGFNGESWPEATLTVPAVGLVDDPSSQQQYPLALSFASCGHTIIYGAPVTGKTTFLQTLIMSMAMTSKPDQVNIYIMDFGGWNLNVLKGLPHVGGIANDNEPERIKKLVLLLQDILLERKLKFSKAGVGNISSYREATCELIPDIILAIDNFGSVLKMYSDLDEFFVTLTASGANYGIYMVATASASNTVPMKISQNIKNSIALQLIDKSDYTYIVGKVSDKLPAIPGRGYIKADSPLEFQTALPAPGETDKAIAENIRKIANVMYTCWQGALPARIPEMPEVIPYGSVKTKLTALGLSADKVIPVSYDHTSQHYLLISGTSQSGKSNMLAVIARQLKEKIGGKLIAFNVRGSISPAISAYADKSLSNAEEINKFIEDLRPELQNRLALKQAGTAENFDPIIITVDNYSQFFKSVSNDTMARLLAIVKIGIGLELYLIIADDSYELASFVNKGESVAYAMARGKQAVLLGGCLNDHNAIPTKTAFAQKSVGVKTGEGFYVNNGEIIRFKAMSSKEANT